MLLPLACVTEQFGNRLFLVNQGVSRIRRICVIEFFCEINICRKNRGTFRGGINAVQTAANYIKLYLTKIDNTKLV